MDATTGPSPELHSLRLRIRLRTRSSSTRIESRRSLRTPTVPDAKRGRLAAGDDR
jgi:hypothetical protein